MEDESKSRRLGDGIALAVLVLLTVGNLLVLLDVVPIYQALYEDKLPGKPLPEATLFVLQAQTMLALFDGILLVFFAIWLLSREKDARIGVYGAMIWNIIQVCFVALALHLPMVGFIYVMAPR